MAKDPVIEFLVKMATEHSQIQRLVLFGSRALGTSHDKSDYDIAVSAPKFSHAEWSAWAESTRENIPTLCGVDLVWVETPATPELQAKIKSEGKIIYEKR